jgi:hypothetical protein
VPRTEVVAAIQAFTDYARRQAIHRQKTRTRHSELKNSCRLAIPG